MSNKISPCDVFDPTGRTIEQLICNAQFPEIQAELEGLLRNDETNLKDNLGVILSTKIISPNIFYILEKLADNLTQETPLLEVKYNPNDGDIYTRKFPYTGDLPPTMKEAGKKEAR